MAELRDIELIYPGRWKGMEFDNDDIVEMVNNSNYCLDETQPQLSLNHSQVAPDIIRHASFGAVASFRLKVEQGCNIMLCTFRNVRGELADLLRYHYTRRSIEFWETYQHRGTGRVLRNVVYGVSFLGARMPPAVKALSPEFAVAYRDDDGRGFARHGRGAMIIVPAWRLSMKATKKVRKHFEDMPVGGEKALDRPITPADSERGSLPTSAFGPYLATRRAELGMTAIDVADAVNAGDEALDQVAEQTVLDLEAGLVMPSEALIAALARVLDAEVATLREMLALPGLNEHQFMDRIVRRVMRRFAEPESLGAYLRQAREDHNWSLEDLAVLLEVTTEELAAIEDAQLPDDDLLAQLAEVLGLDIDDLKARREAIASDMEASQPAPADDGDGADVPVAAQQFAAALAPVQRVVAQLTRERDLERRRRKEDGVTHFLDALRQTYGAAKLLTGPRVKALLLRADDRRPAQFSDGAKPETEFETLKKLLTDIARLGVQAVSVPRGQITTEHGLRASEFSDDAASASRTRQAEAYAQQHNVKFTDALRAVLKQQ